MDEYASLTKPQQVGVQISCCFHSQVPQEDAVRRAEKAPRRGVSQAGAAEGKPDRRGALDAGPRSHDDFDSAEIRGLTGGRFYQGQECHPFGPCVWREEAQLCRAALLGKRLFRLDRRSRRSRDTGVHQEPGARGRPLGPNEFVALIGHLRVANECRAASATLTAASSGPIPKAPGSAGGYLLFGTAVLLAIFLFFSV